MLPLAALSQFPMLLAAVILATDRKIVRRLRAAGATSPATAVLFTPPGPLGRARLRRMVSVGAVGETGGRHFVDAEGFRSWRRKRRTRVVAAMAVALLVLAAIYAVRTGS